MIVAAGLSPAWQQILQFTSFTPGEVNRAEQAIWCASGKVLNVGIALRCLNTDSKTVALVGGDSGRSIQCEFESKGIPATWVECDTPTRVCTTILSNDPPTELVENAGYLESSTLDEFNATFQTEAKNADFVVLSGSLPVGTPDDYYNRLLQNVSGQSILDFRGANLMHALSAKPLLVKPNREELEQTVGHRLTQPSELMAAMQTLIDRGAQWVLVTAGGGTLHLASAKEQFEIEPLNTEVVNPIGCGDCLTAGIAAGLDAGQNLIESVQLGVAAATENLKFLKPAEFDVETVKHAAQSVVIRQIN